MQFAASLALVASLLSSLACGSPLNLHSALESRQDGSSYLSDTGLAKLQSLGFGSQPGVPATGVNAEAAGSSGVWIGGDGPYVSTFTNTSPDEVVLVVWGSEPMYQASFPIAVQPLITVSLAANSGNTLSLSFASGQSGAFAGVYPGTVMSQYGQISNTWGEFTMSPSGVVDVSREVFTQGNALSIVGPGGTTDMNTCVFECVDPSVTTCGDAGSYQLINCATGVQGGNQVSPDGTSGGCGWLGADSASFTTTFS